MVHTVAETTIYLALDPNTKESNILVGLFLHSELHMVVDVIEPIEKRI